MKRMMTLLWAFLFTLVMTRAAAPESLEVAADESAGESLAVVLDLERPDDDDILVLKDGNRLTGTIMNESFSLKTPYGTLAFNSQIVAGIDLGGGPNFIESIVTVNNNRFSGFIEEPIFDFKLREGPQVEIRREKVLKAVFRLRDAEREDMPQRQFLILKNKDFFSGEILNDQFIIATTYAKVPVMLDDVESLTIVGGTRQLTEVVFRNGDFLQGVLEWEDVHVELDIGPTVKIYQDRIHTIYGPEGFVPDTKAPVAPWPLIKLGESETVGYGARFEDQRLKVVKIAGRSPAEKAGWQVGDQIVSIDGEAIDAADALRNVRDEIISGKRQQAIIRVLRGEEVLTFRLIK
jgi:hypothetical protein